MFTLKFLNNYNHIIELHSKSFWNDSKLSKGTHACTLLLSEHYSLSCYGSTLSAVLKDRGVTVGMLKAQTGGPAARSGSLQGDEVFVLNEKWGSKNLWRFECDAMQRWRRWETVNKPATLLHEERTLLSLSFMFFLSLFPWFWLERTTSVFSFLNP